MSNTEWQVAAQSYLARLAAAEYQAGRTACKRKAYRHSPSTYHSDLVARLGANDEEGFKALKMLQGYASVLGV